MAAPNQFLKDIKRDSKGIYSIELCEGKPTRGLATSNLALAFKVQVIQAFKRKIDVVNELELDRLSTANHTPTTKLMFPL